MEEVRIDLRVQSEERKRKYQKQISFFSEQSYHANDRGTSCVDQQTF